MDLKVFLTKEGRKRRSLEKAIEKAANSKIKPEDRYPALTLLLEEGSDEAIQGLLARLVFNYTTNLVADEEEKNFVYEGLVGMGDSLLPALRTHLSRAPSLSWGLRLLCAVADSESVWLSVEGLLATIEPGYTRNPTRKQQILSFIGELEDDSRPLRAALPYLGDHDETVRLLAAEIALKKVASTKAEREVLARTSLLEALVAEDEDSQRLKHRIASGLAEIGWSVKGYRGAVEKALPAEFVVDGKGRIRKKRGR